MTDEPRPTGEAGLRCREELQSLTPSYIPAARRALDWGRDAQLSSLRTDRAAARKLRT